MSEKLDDVEQVDLLATAIGAANQIPAFREKLITGVGIPFNWEQHDGTRFDIGFHVSRGVPLGYEETLPPGVSPNALHCAALFQSSKLLTEWPPEMVIQANQREQELEPVSGRKLEQIHDVDIRFSGEHLEHLGWSESKEFVLSDPDNNFEVVYHNGVLLDRYPSLNEVDTDSDTEDDLLRTLLSDIGQDVIHKQVQLRRRQARTILFCARERMILSEPSFLELGAVK